MYNKCIGHLNRERVTVCSSLGNRVFEHSGTLVWRDGWWYLTVGAWDILRFKVSAIVSVEYNYIELG
jgi:hypothetical protein